MIRKTITTMFVMLFAVVSTALIGSTDGEDARSTEWEIDRAHSAINFSIKHFFTPVNGTFDDYDANVMFNPEDLEGSMIDVTIPISSVNTKNDRRDGHLQSEDFFNVEQWPNMRFVSNSIESRGDNEFVAIGELTIRDVTSEVELPFTLQGIMDHPMQDNTQVAGITSELQINRTDFGVGVGDWAATAVVGDEVNIELNLELTTESM
ncbi:MAG: YceI family protein [Balneolaceae bacterium]